MRRDLIRQGIPALAVDFDQATPWQPPSDLSALVYLALRRKRARRTSASRGSWGAGLRPPRSLRLHQHHGRIRRYGRGPGGRGQSHGAPGGSLPEAAGCRGARDPGGAWTKAVRFVVFRVPAIYGPHRLPLDRLQCGEPVLRAEDSGPGNRIHVDDLVGACLVALERPVAGVFNLTDGLPESMAAFTARVASLAGAARAARGHLAEAAGDPEPGAAVLPAGVPPSHESPDPGLGWTPRYGNPGTGILASLAEMGPGSVAEHAEDGQASTFSRPGREVSSMKTVRAIGWAPVRAPGAGRRRAVPPRGP